MPVPKPKKGEKKQTFISRCIKTLSKKDTDRKREQIIAMCYDAYRKKRGKKK